MNIKKINTAIKKIFNTPIGRKKGLFGEEVVDDSPSYGMGTSLVFFLWFILTPFLTIPTSVRLIDAIGLYDTAPWTVILPGYIITLPLIFLILKAGRTDTPTEKIYLDLKKVSDKQSLFTKLSETLIIQDWGHNWDALNDCLKDLDSGGFTKKHTFPLEIRIINWKEFKASNPEDFSTFEEVLSDQISEHKRYQKSLQVKFLN